MQLAGIKYRRGLAWLSWDQAPRRFFAGLVSGLARRRVNLPFLHLSHRETGGGCLCLEVEDLAAALELAGAHPAPPRVVSPVALAMIFPRRSDLRVPGAVLAALAAAGLKPLSLGTSLGALALALEEARLDESLAAITAAMPLPPGRAPNQETIRVRQAPIFGDKP